MTDTHELGLPSITPLFECDYYMFDEHIEFYTALGFKITYYQKAPYRYASVKKDNIGEIGFYGDRKFKDKESHSGCYVSVSDVKAVYEEMKSNLKRYYGKIPVKGHPRFSRLNRTAEDIRFNITDKCGNMIIVGQMLGDSSELMDIEEKRVKSLKSRFEKAYAQAYRFAHSKEDFLAARNTLEVAFNKFDEDCPDEIVYKARVLQAEVFSTLYQFDEAEKAVKAAAALTLSDEAVQAVTEFRERLEEVIEEIDENAP